MLTSHWPVFHFHPMVANTPIPLEALHWSLMKEMIWPFGAGHLKLFPVLKDSKSGLKMKNWKMFKYKHTRNLTEWRKCQVCHFVFKQYLTVKILTVMFVMRNGNLLAIIYPCLNYFYFRLGCAKIRKSWKVPRKKCKMYCSMVKFKFTRCFRNNQRCCND